MTAQAEAERLIAAGWRVWPISARTLTPTRAGFARANGADVCAAAEEFGAKTEVGVLCGPCAAARGGRLVCVDFDGPVPEEARFRQWPATLTSKQGAHRWYRVAEDSVFFQSVRVRQGPGWAVDTRDFGGYARETKNGEGLWDNWGVTPADLSEAQVRELFPAERLGGRAATALAVRPSAQPEALPWDHDTVVEMFRDPELTNHKAGGVGRCLYRFGFTPEYAETYVRGILEELAHPAAARHAGSARAACGPLSTAWGIPSLVANGVRFSEAGGAPLSEIEAAAPLRLRRNPDDRARPWWVYNGALWVPASEGGAEEAVHAFPGPLGPMLDVLPTAKRVRTRNALLADQHRYELTAPELDQEPELLMMATAAAGLEAVCDLRTGELRTPRPEDRCSRQAGAFAGGATEAVERVFEAWAGGDRELAAYLWAVAGYAATGEAREKALWVFYGPPDTGKTTFVEHVAACLGTYATHVPIDTWLAGTRKGDADESLGRIGANARLVISPELPQGRSFDISRTTAFTGGDILTAAGKWKSEREFRPRAKLWIAGNYPPSTKGYKASFAARLRVVPFEHVFERSTEFQRALVGMRAATLGRIVREAGEYLRRGLPGVPSAVAKASAEVTAESDTFGQWLAALAAPGEWSASGELLRTWHREHPGLAPANANAFAREMSRFPQFAPRRRTIGSGYDGLHLRM